MTREAELPDGTILEFPDDTPDDVMDRTVRAHLGVAPRADFSGVTSRVLPSPEPSLGERASQFGRDVARQLGLGGRAVLEGAYSIPGLVLDPILGAAGQPTSQQAAEQHADILGLPRPASAAERVSGGVTRALTSGGGLIGTGRALVGQAPGAVRAIGQALSAQPGAQIAGTALGAGASEVTREAGGTPGQQLAAGLAGGLAPSLPRVAGDIASGVLQSRPGEYITGVTQARKELGREAAARGIELSPAQLSDSRFLKWAQSALRSIPFTGAQGRYEKQVGQFNRALAREIGEDADNLGPEVYSRAKQRQSEQFDELTARNALRVDDRLIRSLSNIAEGAKIGGQDITNQVESAIEALYSQATTGPGGVVIPGAAYQLFDSQLGNLTKAGGPQSYFVGQVQSAVRDAMDRSITPRDAQAWRQLRREYGSRKTIAPLVARAGPDGAVSPSGLQSAVTATRTGKEAQAAGQRGNLGTLARIGQTIKEPPSSGTAERLTTTSLLGGASVVDPVTGGLTAAGLNLLSRGLDSRSLARLMIRENPGLTEETAQAIIQRSLVPTTVTTQQNMERRR